MAVKLPRACNKRSAIATIALLAAAHPASADFPEQNITLVVPFAAGGSTDTIARIVGDHMARTLGRSIIVENDAGASEDISDEASPRARVRAGTAQKRLVPPPPPGSSLLILI